MNKHRKAESRKAKAYVRLLRDMGYNPSYKRTRRHIRKCDRAMRNLSKTFSRGLRRGIRCCDYGVSNAVRGIGMRANVVLIDEWAFRKEENSNVPD